MSTTTTATTTEPTLARYQCGSGCGPLTFSWGRQMPDNGRLGTVTLGQFVNKPIQVFDAQPLYYNNVEIGKNWAFQAQDGSFLGRTTSGRRPSASPPPPTPATRARASRRPRRR
jgi:hypothetical protein